MDVKLYRHRWEVFVCIHTPFLRRKVRYFLRAAVMELDWAQCSFSDALGRMERDTNKPAVHGPSNTIP